MHRATPRTKIAASDLEARMSPFSI